MDMQYEVLWFEWMQKCCNAWKQLPAVASEKREDGASVKSPLSMRFSGGEGMKRGRSQFVEFVCDALTYMATHGIVTIYAPYDRSWRIPPLFPGGRLKFVPVSLFPTPFPRRCYREALDVVTIFNSLVDALSCNIEWMLTELSDIGEIDAYVRNLLDISSRVYGSNGRSIQQDIRATLVRSDYMTDPSCDAKGRPIFHIKQIELNTISVSCGSFSVNLGNWHRMAVRRVLTALSPSFRQLSNDAKEDALQHYCPTNCQIEGFADALHLSSDTYCKRYKTFHAPAVLWVVASAEVGEVDHRHLLYALETRHHLKSIKVTFDELLALQANGDFYARRASDVEPITTLYPSLYEPSRLFIREHLFSDDDERVCEYELTVIYYRYAYVPEHFAKASHWALLECLEWSHAVKIPSIPTTLAGSKKIQQRWCDPAVLRRFLPRPEDQKALQRCFALQVDPRNESEQAVVQQAIENSDAFVLKPQREGGGNNLHGDMLVQQVKQELQKEKNKPSNYVLMAKIRPPILNTLHIKTVPEDPSEVALQLLPTISEFSTYGCSVYDGKKSLLDMCPGTLLRTKAYDALEGGFYNGVSSIDSVFLYDEANTESLFQALRHDR